MTLFGFAKKLTEQQLRTIVSEEARRVVDSQIPPIVQLEARQGFRNMERILDLVLHNEAELKELKETVRIVEAAISQLQSQHRAGIDD